MRFDFRYFTQYRNVFLAETNLAESFHAKGFRSLFRKKKKGNIKGLL